MTKLYGNLSEKLLFIYLPQISNGLIYLHAKGIVHRNLRASNLLISKEGIVKLNDFGLSHLIDGHLQPGGKVDALRTLRRNKSLSESGLQNDIEAPFWMAPEVISGEQNEDSATAQDIWSLGCTVIELLTTKPPYWDLPINEVCAQMMSGRPPYPLGISTRLEGLLDMCFIRNAESRPSSAEISAYLKLNPSSARKQPVSAPESESIMSPRTDPSGFFEIVKKEFPKRPQVFSEFVISMRRFKLGQIDAQEVARCAEKLFRGRPGVVASFNDFLPKNVRIEVEKVPFEEEPSSPILVFLENARLEEYYSGIVKLASNMTQLAKLQDDELESIGMKPFHRKRLLKCFEQPDSGTVGKETTTDVSAVSDSRYSDSQEDEIDDE